jgi:hypothetical protein
MTQARARFDDRDAAGKSASQYLRRYEGAAASSSYDRDLATMALTSLD